MTIYHGEQPHRIAMGPFGWEWCEKHQEPRPAGAPCAKCNAAINAPAIEQQLADLRDETRDLRTRVSALEHDRDLLAGLYNRLAEQFDALMLDLAGEVLL